MEQGRCRGGGFASFCFAVEYVAGNEQFGFDNLSADVIRTNFFRHRKSRAELGGGESGFWEIDHKTGGQRVFVGLFYQRVM